MRRAFSSVILALVLAAPVAVSAQTNPAAQPDSLAALTHSYFDAIQRDDVGALSGLTSDTFHEIGPDGKRSLFEEFIRSVSAIYFIAQYPMGTTAKIGATTITPTSATESVDSVRWYMGATSEDISMGTVPERRRSMHQLVWVKSSTGKWLLDEDHVISSYLQ